MLNARVCARLRALHVVKIFIWEIKKKKVQNQNVTRDDSGIIQIQRSFNLQIVFGFCDCEKRLNRFFSRHTTNFAAGSAGPRGLVLVAHLMGFLLWPTGMV